MSLMNSYIDKLSNVSSARDVIQLLDQLLQVELKDSYTICLLIDEETFDFSPLRSVDKALMQNIEDYIDQGICAEALMSGRPFYIFDSKHYDLKANEGLILFPMIIDGKNFGILIIVTTQEECRRVLNEKQDEMNDLCSVASKFVEVYCRIENQQDEKNPTISDNISVTEIIESVVHGVVVFNKSNKVIVYNQNAELMFGMPSDEVVGKNYREVFGDRIVRSFDLLMQNTHVEGNILDFELEIELNAQIKIPIGISSSLIRGSEGDIKGVLFICRDMSLTKEVNRLKELDKMKSEFVSTVSHELKNPIAVIKSSIEVLLTARKMGKQLPDNFEVDAMVTVNGEIDRLSELINDLLSLSRMESGKVELNRVSVDIEDMIASTVQLFQVSGKTHPIVTEVSVKDSILIDVEKIRQVVINYINNAIKYSPDGSEIHVKAIQDDVKVTITVKDQGLGIPEDQVDRVFDKFFRVKSDKTEKISGTGLGLAICRKIVELHHGKVWVKSFEGEGSTFALEIPVTFFVAESSEENPDDA